MYIWRRAKKQSYTQGVVGSNQAYTLKFLGIPQGSLNFILMLISGDLSILKASRSDTGSREPFTWTLFLISCCQTQNGNEKYAPRSAIVLFRTVYGIRSEKKEHGHTSTNVNL